MPVDLSSIPNRGQLLSDIRLLLKCARTPLTTEADKRLGLTEAGLRGLVRLAHRMSANVYFEHHDFKALQEELWEVVRGYRAKSVAERPKWGEVSQELLLKLAREPVTQIAYLGIHHLDLPAGASIGAVRFLHPGDEDDLADAFAHLGDPPRLIGAVEVVAGTDDLALMRARQAVLHALALIRQQTLFGFSAKIYPGQVAYGLDSRYTWRREGELRRAGWWGGLERPMDTDLSSQQPWAHQLRELSARRDALKPRLRERVDTCLDWLDIAALSIDWRVIIPAVFGAMEAILVPESSGLKAGAVTVRSVAVHVAVGNSFFHPRKTVYGYYWRSQLVHGEPTYDVNEKDALEFAEDRRRWAFLVHSDYLKLTATSSFDSVKAVVAHLDAGPANDVCKWLEEQGGEAVVEEYRKMLQGQ
jgi:hypothetical protein